MASLHAISRRLRLGEDRVAHRAFSECFAGLVVCTVMAATEKRRLLRLAVGAHDIADVAIDLSPLRYTILPPLSVYLST